MSQTKAQLISDLVQALAFVGTSSAPTNGVYLPAANTLGLSTNSTERLLITSAGLVGIGTSSPSHSLHIRAGNAASLKLETTAASSDQTQITFTGTTGDRWAIGNNAATGGTGSNFDFYDLAASANRLRIDSSGRLLVGTSTSISTGGSYTPGIQVAGTGANSAIAVGDYRNSNNAGVIALQKSRSASIGSQTIVQSGDTLGVVQYEGSDGSSFLRAAAIAAEVDGTPGANDMPGRLVFSTTADGASSPATRFVIKSDGYIYVQEQGQAEAFNTFGPATQCAFYVMSSANFNAANTGMKIGRNSSTLRSINAGGTVNASGADYAEYMVKAGDFTIAKGAVCGVTADGLLTLDYGDAVSFVVKSTNPSYVGGDTWGSEDVIGKKPEIDDAEALAQWEADLEAVRQTVDRIAFAGQVPVNVMGATPGQYIVPVEAADGGIEGIAKNEADLTLAEYMRAVGKVIAIEDDGRARIIVKVA